MDFSREISVKWHDKKVFTLSASGLDALRVLIIAGYRIMLDDNQFDFDKWRKLAEKDPEKFEEQRYQLLSRLIESMPGAERKQRMRGLQWRIDMERKRAKNPIDSTLRIYRMMWDSVSKNYEEMQNLLDLFDGKVEQVARIEREKKSADVLSFDSGKRL
ncbi:MAG: DUF3135 domain-containing protein, partial [Gammaproteobacteria bacterium]|nr:DUF3135 domain-containing protein [Gammaproteobacteria bacterium]